jgi:hypothetical protein
VQGPAKSGCQSPYLTQATADVPAALTALTAPGLPASRCDRRSPPPPTLSSPFAHLQHVLLALQRRLPLLPLLWRQRRPRRRIRLQPLSLLNLLAREGPVRESEQQAGGQKSASRQEGAAVQRRQERRLGWRPNVMRLGKRLAESCNRQRLQRHVVPLAASPGRPAEGTGCR